VSSLSWVLISALLSTVGRHLIIIFLVHGIVLFVGLYLASLLRWILRLCSAGSVSVWYNLVTSVLQRLTEIIMWFLRVDVWILLVIIARIRSWSRSGLVDAIRYYLSWLWLSERILVIIAPRVGNGSIWVKTARLWSLERTPHITKPWGVYRR
jgi:hypothetical protein